jgi:hypothetical protein
VCLLILRMNQWEPQEERQRKSNCRDNTNPAFMLEKSVQTISSARVGAIIANL